MNALHTIDGVDGLATAAGCQLIATCDGRLARAFVLRSRILPHRWDVNIGLFCSTPMVIEKQR